MSEDAGTIARQGREKEGKKMQEEAWRKREKVREHDWNMHARRKAN